MATNWHRFQFAGTAFAFYSRTSRALTLMPSSSLNYGMADGDGW
jgi:hypothetical protein